ncbi:E3 ubiquitin protein ligase DRIP2-like [Salvia hispanica]|uniref:E3 ubiquitin protein ligase DRIP2-like n=1 Tax=Salvia hispanica TaxID=49212 RepID=UPI002009095A|nr:E3 ubiquitin protein ligase DRIP2-like [Salvia hispanica]XP_047966941.1 E3 ubiquitin protein ligase DRIP2-like [Salvia hispanica]
MSHQVVKLRREGLAPCMTCPLCHKLFREATTIIECLHTFCRKCINKKLSDEELECCPVCNIDLGCVPLEKLRLDHNLQDVRAKIFPYKRMKVRAPEVVSPVTSPVKRKERSLSSLVVSTPRVSTQSGMTGRRSKSITRKASRGSSFTIEKPIKKDDYTMDYHHESSSSPETLNRSTQNTRKSSISSDPSNHASPDKGRENGFETLEGKVDWKPLNCLVEAANRTKSSKFSMQGVVSKSEAPNSHDNEGPNKSRSKENRQKSKLQDVKNLNNHTPPDSKRPKKLRKVRQKKTQDFGEFRVPPKAVLDAAGAKFERKNHPIWFSLVADGQEGDALPLPQIAASYFRIKEGGMPVSSIRKYLKLKLDLTSEDEVEIKCMGQAVIPTLTLNNVVDLWLQTTTTEKVSAKIGSSAKDLVMVLGYARRS